MIGQEGKIGGGRTKKRVAHEWDTIRLNNVKKWYPDGNFKALDGVTVSVKKEEFLVIRGRSGSGKSTLLHMMGCLDRPTDGDVYINGMKTSDLSEDELAAVRRKTMGFVFQAFNLVPTLDALHNVAMPMMFEGIGKPEREERAETLLESVGLGSKIHSYPNELSGGEKQRVAIARALANDPEIILADEPTGNLDSVSAKQVLEVFDEFHHKRNKTVVVVTHEEYVAEMAERTLYMKDGKISQYSELKGKVK